MLVDGVLMEQVLINLLKTPRSMPLSGAPSSQGVAEGTMG